MAGTIKQGPFALSFHVWAGRLTVQQFSLSWNFPYVVQPASSPLSTATEPTHIMEINSANERVKKPQYFAPCRGQNAVVFCGLNATCAVAPKKAGPPVAG